MIKKTFILSLLLVVCYCHNAAMAAEGATESEFKKPAPAKAIEAEIPTVEEVAKPTENETSLLAEQLKEIVGILKTKYPAVLQQQDKAKSEKLINHFLKSMGDGLHFSYKKYENESHKKDSDGISEVFPAVIIASNRVLYIRIDEFSKKTFDKLLEDLQMSVNLAKKPFGIIIDLRNCQGYDTVDALKCLALFCPANELPEFKEIKGIKQVIDIPCTVLIGKQTAGAAEAFIHVLKNARNCLTIGKKTSGDIFPLETINLTSGGNLCLPVVPDFYQDLSIKAITPDISVKAYPQLSYKNVSQKLGSEKKDRCLQRATDLLICIHNLKK